MSKIEDKLKEMGYELPPPPTPGGNYVPTVSTSGGLVYTAGHVSTRPDGSQATGKLGADTTVEEGYEAARITALNLLTSLKAELGDLDRVKRVVKLLCMVNSAPDFGQQPAVANGASDLLVEPLGRRGPSRPVGGGDGEPAQRRLGGDRDDRGGVGREPSMGDHPARKPGVGGGESLCERCWRFSTCDPEELRAMSARVELHLP